ncbi:hypothetical protein [Methylobacterium flocculans]|uniref:hypothetical protein n=1 Tax=Methylobacterium flocculans TaxID=2984843 RepID=UPI0021F335CC|nr:hypothetical protein [Methylobacterium sp. FF17]
MPSETSSANEALATASYDTARVRMVAGEKERESKPSINVNDDDIVDVVEPSYWTSNADTGSKDRDIHKHAGVAWQAPSSLAE